MAQHTAAHWLGKFRTLLHIGTVEPVAGAGVMENEKQNRTAQSLLLYSLAIAAGA